MAGALDGRDGLDELAEVDLGLVERWAAQLDELGELIGSRFFRPEPRERALGYVKGLLWPGAGETRNGWTLAQAAGERSPDGMQRLLNRAVWDESGVREDLRGYVVEALGAPDGVLVFDETGDIKAGPPHRGGGAAVRRGDRAGGELPGVGARGVCVLARASADRRRVVSAEGVCAGPGPLHRGRGARAPRRGGGHQGRSGGDLAVGMLHRAVAAGMPFGYVAGDEV